MEWADWVAVFLAMFACVMVGLTWGWFWHKYVVSGISAGVLKIDTSDPDGPYLFLELHEHINTLSKQKYATFDIDISQ